MKAGEWLVDGIGHLRKVLLAHDAGELSLSKYAEGEACRVLRLLGEPMAKGRAESYAQASLDVMEERLRLVEGQQTGLHLVQWDGGWSSEVGAASDLSATVLGLGCYLDFSGMSPVRQVLSGYRYLQRWCAGGRWDGLRLEDGSRPSLRLELSFYVLLCQLWRGGAFEHVGRERELAVLSARLAEEVGAYARLSAQVGIYETALWVYGECLRGQGAGCAELAEELVAQQSEEGSWRDVGMADEYQVMTTGAVLLALHSYAALETVQEVPLQWRLLDCRNNSEGIEVNEGEIATMLEVCQGEDDSQELTLTVYDQAGGVCSHQSDAQGSGILECWFGNWAPGDYEVVVRQWVHPGRVLAGEVRRTLSVQGWHDVQEFRLVDAGVSRMLLVGQEAILRPDVLVEIGGNEACRGVLSAQLRDPAGHVVAVSDDIELDSTLPAIDNMYHLDDMPCSFQKKGVYELTITLRLEGDEQYQVTGLFSVEDSMAIRVEEMLVPKILPTQSAVGQIQLKVGILGGLAAHGLAAAFTEMSPIDVDNEPGGAAVPIVLQGIVNSRGLAITSGWVVVRADYGQCVGGMSLTTGDVSLTAYEVRQGQCQFAYVAGGNNQESVTTLRVYSALSSNDHVEMFECIGVVELLLHGKKNGVMKIIE